MLTTLGARSFSAAAPKLWNELPVELRQATSLKSDGQEISTIEWQELKNEFRLFSDYKKLLRIEEIQCISFSSGAL